MHLPVRCTGTCTGTTGTTVGMPQHPISRNSFVWNTTVKGKTQLDSVTGNINLDKQTLRYRVERVIFTVSTMGERSTPERGSAIPTPT